MRHLSPRVRFSFARGPTFLVNAPQPNKKPEENSRLLRALFRVVGNLGLCVGAVLRLSDTRFLSGSSVLVDISLDCSFVECLLRVFY